MAERNPQQPQVGDTVTTHGRSGWGQPVVVGKLVSVEHGVGEIEVGKGVTRKRSMRNVRCACTVLVSGRVCGKAAVYVEQSAITGGLLGECREHDAQPHSLRSTRSRQRPGELRVGDRVVVHRYGKEYDAEVTHVGKRGAAYATFQYGNGATRTVRVEGS